MRTPHPHVPLPLRERPSDADPDPNAVCWAPKFWAKAEFQAGFPVVPEQGLFLDANVSLIWGILCAARLVPPRHHLVALTPNPAIEVP
jgi:hypothetical protein